ncbi:MAG: hypothetical protein H6859_11040 [Rhodospirillales bacterium]|nr:hypothetical protein [Alphaproteobacteria bacterium]USO05629.1 MAG: hypothetical protein H6859_11040 [Rhodospirillales bacterium]
MLTGPEKSRVKKFTVGMDENTANAMLNLFILTKPGCDAAAGDLMMAAHGHYPRVCASTIGAYQPYGLVRADGSIPAPVKLAIQKAVAQNYLVMHGPKNPVLKPDLRDFYEYSLTLFRTTLKSFTPALQSPKGIAGAQSCPAVALA